MPRPSPKPSALTGDQRRAIDRAWKLVTAAERGSGAVAELLGCASESGTVHPYAFGSPRWVRRGRPSVGEGTTVPRADCRSAEAIPADGAQGTERRLRALSPSGACPCWVIGWRTIVRRSMSELRRGWPDGPASDSVQGPDAADGQVRGVQFTEPWSGNVKRTTILVSAG